MRGYLSSRHVVSGVLSLFSTSPLYKSGFRQRYLCKSCSRRFIQDDGFKKMRHKPQVIARAIHMHQDGTSFFKVQTHLWQHDGVRVSRQTLTKWEKKYSNFLKSAARRGKSYNQRKNTR